MKPKHILLAVAPLLLASSVHSVGAPIVTAEVNGTNAQIKIVDYIGDYENTGGSMRRVVDELLTQGVRTADVYLNSQGGSVFDASEIANQLSRIPKVTITVGALAASAATYLVSKFHTVASANSQFMIHKPSLFASGNESEVQSQLKLLQNLTAEYKAAYASKTGKTEDEIEALWAKGDYWMNADEALSLGLIDKIITEDVEMDYYDIALLRACAAPNIPDKPKNSNIKMDKLKLIASLGLPADATDEQIGARIAELKQKEHQLSAMEALANQKAQALVDKAIQEKRIQESEREAYQQFAKANYEAAEKLIGGTPSIPKPTATIPGTVPAGSADVRANWTLEDYLEKAPEALAELESADPQKFKALNDTYYGK